MSGTPCISTKNTNDPVPSFRAARKRSGSRQMRVGSHAAALKHLQNYRWSSYADYCGKKNFPSIISKQLFGDVFKNYEKTISTYLKDIELVEVKPFLLE